MLRNTQAARKVSVGDVPTRTSDKDTAHHDNRVLVERPFANAFLQTVPGLWAMRMFAALRGTNIPVSEGEWQAMRRFLDEV